MKRNILMLQRAMWVSNAHRYDLENVMGDNLNSIS